jgi:hypothetical protein
MFIYAPFLNVVVTRHACKRVGALIIITILGNKILTSQNTIFPVFYSLESIYLKVKKYE